MAGPHIRALHPEDPLSPTGRTNGGTRRVVEVRPTHGKTHDGLEQEGHRITEHLRATALKISLIEIRSSRRMYDGPLAKRHLQGEP